MTDAVRILLVIAFAAATLAVNPLAVAEQTEKDTTDKIIAESTPAPNTPAEESAPEKKAGEDYKLPEVVVEDSEEGDDKGYTVEESTSGTKTNTPLIETPQSITVITKDRIDAQDADNLGQALRYSAGISAETFGYDDRGYDFTQIRGFFSDTYRDGLPVRNLVYAGFDFRTYSLERIEVLRGPASVLYGQVSPGGLVNLISKKPLFLPYGEVAVEAGSYDTYEAKFDVSGPLGKNKNFAFRVTGLASTGDAQVDFIENNRIFLAPSLTWRIGSDTKLTLLGYYQNDALGGASNSFLPASGTVFANPNGKVHPDFFTGDPQFDNIDRKQFSIGWIFEHRFNDYISFKQNARYDYVDVDFEELYGTGLDPNDPSQRTLTRHIFTAYADAKPLAVDNQGLVKFSTGPVDHKVLVGTDFQHVDFNEIAADGPGPSIDMFDPEYGVPITLPPPVYEDINQKQTQFGFYMQEQAKLWDRLVLLFGGRIDRADTDTDDKLAGTKTSQDDTEFTWRAGAVYVTPWGLAPYVSYSESFQPTLGLDDDGDPLVPETGQQYEVGVKYQPVDWNAFITVAAFHLTRQNVVVFTGLTQNQTGEIRSRGVEVEGVASLDFGLDLIAAYTYLDVEITENGGVNEGNTPASNPEHAASLWADYTFPTGILTGLGVGAGVRYVGKVQGDDANTFEVADYILGDASIHYDWRKFRAAVNVQNITDNEHIEGCFSQDGCFYGAVRKMTASIRYRW